MFQTQKARDSRFLVDLWRHRGSRTPSPLPHSGQTWSWCLSNQASGFAEANCPLGRSDGGGTRKRARYADLVAECGRKWVEGLLWASGRGFAGQYLQSWDSGGYGGCKEEEPSGTWSCWNGFLLALCGVTCYLDTCWPDHQVMSPGRTTRCIKELLIYYWCTANTTDILQILLIYWYTTNTTYIMQILLIY